MYRRFRLPGGFILFISFLLTTSLSTLAEPTTSLDPFREIAKYVHREPEQPVCCLTPLTSSEPTEEILSFEDWKAKQESLLHNEQAQVDNAKASTSSNAVGGHSSTEAQQESPDSGGINVEGSIHSSSSFISPEPLQPAHSRVPLTDRFNYASLDCSARVYQAHRSARSPAAVLSSKKDKYLLSPCQTPEEKFLVIELCDDIRIDTVQLANFEFFSGVFKDFSVSVARTYPENPRDWTPAGTYRAKNVRGIQSFHTPVSLRDFYRYIRIDFHSYFGNEYYCPISLLRVYGLTHLEQWKWEVWETEYEARQGENAIRSISSGPNQIVDDIVKLSKEATEEVDNHNIGSNVSSKLDSSFTDSVIPATTLSESSPTGTSSTKIGSAVSSDTITSHILSSTAENLSLPESEVMKVDDPTIHNIISASTFEPLSSNTVEIDVSISELTHEVLDTASSANTFITPDVTAKAGEMTQVSSSSVPTVIPHDSRAVPAGVTSGESIYRTIMTRLNLLEGNSTLYLRYVEEQTRSMRDALRRLEEDLGRIEGIGRIQSQHLQKALNDWDRQRRRLEREHNDLQTRLNYLTDEVILEKRLGIAQLFLLLTVLVFMALTRGSRGDPIIAPRAASRRDSLREWGKRHLSSFGSGEWTMKVTKGSPADAPTDFKKKPLYSRIEDKEKMRAAGERFKEGNTHFVQRTPENVSTPPIKYRTPSEIRAPHPRQAAVSHRPKTPTSASHTARSSGLLLHSVPGPSTPGRPKLRRTSSHNSPITISHPQSISTITSIPVSAKKWAKSAHLHEMRRGVKHAHKQVYTSLSSKGIEAQSDHRNSSLTREGQKNGLKMGSDTGLIWPENSDGARGRRKDQGEYKVDDSFEDRDSSRRLPLSVLPLQNRTRSREGCGAQPRLNTLGSPWHEQSGNNHAGNRNIIDLGTESESWIDTDIEESVDEHSPL